MKTYIGTHEGPQRWVVRVREENGGIKPLELHSRHSPTGHAWGYGGSGPAQLALDLLWDVTGEEPQRSVYQEFKWKRIVRIPMDDDWEMTEQEIQDWIKEHKENA